MSALLSVLVPALGVALLHFLWQGALLACATALVLALLRNARPQSRYAVTCVAMGLCIVLPVQEIFHYFTTSSLPALAGDSGAPGELGGWAEPALRQLPWLVLLWASGAALMLTRLMLGMLWVRRIGRAGQGGENAHWQARLGRLATQMGLSRHIALRVVADLAGPITAGWWRPVVLLPAALLSHMPADLLEALLAHEVAHIKRMDYLVNLMQSLVEALLFYHPAVWWLSRRVRIEREQIADDLAAQLLGEPRRLAVALRELSLFQLAAPQLAQAAHGGKLLDRIKRLVRPTRQPLGWKTLVPVLGIAVSSLIIHAHGTVTAPIDVIRPATLLAKRAEPSLAPASLDEYGPLFSSKHVLVLEEGSGKVLLTKNADSVVPIASLTKLMTAMVVLDAKPDMNEPISIGRGDIDTLKHSASHVPVGASLPRLAVMKLALMSSDNRAAKALARSYPGGMPAFEQAVRTKIQALGLTHTSLHEPTGLSPQNTSTAVDVAKMVGAASRYPEIASITTGAKDTFMIRGKPVEYHNTNRLVGKAGWNILLSKTGFTTEAGRCLIMRLNAAGKRVTMVLLDAGAASARTLDAMNIRRLLDATPSGQG